MATRTCQFATGSAKAQAVVDARNGGPREDGRWVILCGSTARWQVTGRHTMASDAEVMDACDRCLAYVASSLGGAVSLVGLRSEETTVPVNEVNHQHPVVDTRGILAHIHEFAEPGHTHKAVTHICDLGPATGCPGVPPTHELPATVLVDDLVSGYNHLLPEGGAELRYYAQSQALPMGATASIIAPGNIVYRLELTRLN